MDAMRTEATLLLAKTTKMRTASGSQLQRYCSHSSQHDTLDRPDGTSPISAGARAAVSGSQSEDPMRYILLRARRLTITGATARGSPVQSPFHSYSNR